MDLDTQIVAVFCRIDGTLQRIFREQPRLRSSGPEPALSDAEVLTIEAVGEFLGLSQDTDIYRYFRQHYRAFFPALGQISRTTFVRQGANLWRVKERVWSASGGLGSIQHDPAFAIVDSLPLPVCRFARAYRCQRFKGEAAYGWDEVARQSFYGFRIHLRLCWPGLITGFSVAPANAHDLARVPELTAGTQGVLLGDRNYWSPALTEELQG